MSKADLWDLNLEEGEVILWSQQSSRLRNFLLCLAVLIFIILLGWAVMNELVAARAVRDSAICATGYCGDDSLKLGLAFLLSLILGILIVLAMILLMFVKNLSALTNRRMVRLHDAVWRRAPRNTSIRLEVAEAYTIGSMIKIWDKQANKEIVVTSLTKKSDARFFSAFEAAKKNRLGDMKQCPTP